MRQCPGAFYIDEGARANITGTMLCNNKAATGPAAAIGEDANVIFDPICCLNSPNCFEASPYPLSV
jgi:hypothetical protein